MADETPEVVVVTPPAPEPETEPAAEGGDASVVIIDADTPSASSDEIPNDWVERIVKLEGRVEDLETRVPAAEFTAEIAQETADTALEVATDVLENADEVAEDIATDVVESAEIETDDETGEQTLEVPEDAIEPRSSRVHPLFRSRSEWSNH